MDKRHIREKAEAQRHSNIEFHSFRRWFITKAEEAGVPPNIISTVVGHAGGLQGMTLGVYSGGPSLDQLRACVGAVRLPARLGVEAGSPTKGVAGHLHAELDSFISTMPLTISAAASRRSPSAGSPSIAIPTRNAPTAPMPVQTM
jgi:hypothetical protein